MNHIAVLIDFDLVAVGNFVRAIDEFRSHDLVAPFRFINSGKLTVTDLLKNLDLLTDRQWNLRRN